ncbi:Rrf2 family transcriptional regulator [Aerococcaceae bacterium 50-4]
MKFSKGTDYALHAMVFLASQSDKDMKFPVGELAKKLRVSNAYLSKILAQLVKQKYIVASSGAKGGYSLPHNWPEFTVYDIVVAIDGEPSLFEDSFNHGEECKIQRLMMTIEDDMVASLKDKTIQSLL